MRVETFPHQKHISTGEILASQALDLEKVLREIEIIMGAGKIN
jgi:hypothetical protein